MPNHVNRKAFQVTVDIFSNLEPQIIETETAAWGTNSTRLWDACIRKNRVKLVSLDIRPEASARLDGQLSRFSKYVISDSVAFLSRTKTHADLYFLDIRDVDWANPHESVLLGVAEFNAKSDRLKPGNLILIYDTPVSAECILTDHHSEAKFYFETYGVWPGKGALVFEQIMKSGKYEVLFHEYTLLFRKE
jgi:hypothetical protein